MPERRLIHDLASFVPRMVAERFGMCPEPPSEPLMEHLEAAVLFADISGFTKLAETLSQRGPAGIDQLTRTLNVDMGCLVNVIYDHGGDVIKFAGDALLALWHPDPARPRDAVLRAAHCGLEAQERFRNLPEVSGMRISVRIVVSAGPLNLLMVGGVEDRWELVAAGEALEQIRQASHAGRPGEVVLSPEAWEKVETAVTGRDIGHGVMQLISAPETHDIGSAPAVRLTDECTAALRCFVPTSVLAFLESGRGDWIGELRRVSVMFALFPGLTSSTPLERAQMATRSLQTVLYRYEGTINKLSVDDKGTALLAAFGLPPLAHEDDAARAAAAGLEIYNRMQEVNIKTSIGIATGRAFCGIIGAATRREYTMIGDVVNVGARLMLAAAGGIFCCPATEIAAHNRVLFESLPEIELKGKSGRIRPFRPVGEHAKGPAEPSAETPIVGREAERALLEASVDKLQTSGSGGTLLVEGGPGIGKSRLLAWFAECAEARGVPLLKGSASPLDRSTPYYAWREVMATLLNLDVAATVPERRERILAVVRSNAPQQESQLALGNPVFLTDFEEPESIARLPEEVRAAITRDLLASLIAALPVPGTCRVLILGDVHWMDSASWALALEVARRNTTLLLVLSARPFREEPVELRTLLELPGSSRLHLEPLTAEDSIRIMCRCLSVDSAPPQVVAVIRDKAEGNPLFVEELAHALVEAGHLVVDGSNCRLAEGAGMGNMDLPPTVQAAMTMRIDRLPAGHQVALKSASVIGRQFAARVLEHLCPGAAQEAPIEAMLEEMRHRDLTLRAQSAELAYRFKHALLQDVAYNLMLFAQRRQLHQTMAEWIEAQRDSRASQNPVLAHHWSKVVEYGGTQPVLVGKAAEYFHKSAEQALRSFANREAITFLREEERLLGMLPAGAERDRKQLSLLCALGPPLTATLGFAAPEVEQTYMRARELCREREVTLERFQLMRGLWNCREVKGHLRQARELAQELLELSGLLADNGVQLAANRALAENTLWLGEFPLASRLLDESLKLILRRQHGSEVAGMDTDAGVVCLGFSAWVLWFQGFPDDSAKRMDEALALARKTEHPHSIALTYQNLAMLAQFREDPAPARHWAEALDELAQKEGFRMWGAAAKIMHGWAAARLGKRAEGIAELRHGLTEWRSTGAVLAVPYYLALLADVLIESGEPAEAMGVLEEAQARGDESGEGWWLAEILRQHGVALALVERSEEAGEFFRKAIVVSEQQQARSLEVRARNSLDDLAWKSGRAGASS
jgi:class 3 adenylate cyclase/predicted ATPase